MAARCTLSVALALLAALAPVADAGVVRPAPAFTFGGAGGKNSLGNMRGQPVVLGEQIGTLVTPE